MAISVEPDRWQAIVARFVDAGVAHEIHSGVSVYFTDPDGARIELIADPGKNFVLIMKDGVIYKNTVGKNEGADK